MQESGENYLETILILQQRLDCVRSIDVANELNYSKPSVSRAMAILKENGYIAVGPGGAIRLTDKGAQKAGGIYERHLVISGFLRSVLGVSGETATQDACRVEHIISEETFEKIKAFMESK